MSRRGDLVQELFLALREVRGRLLQVNQSVGDHVGLGPVDMEFVDLIARMSPVTPGELAARSGLSPATVTGILDRLEKDGWILRERDTEDRRKVLIKARLERTPELGRLFAPMLGRMSEVLKGYSDDDLEVVVGFLKQVREAGDGAVAELRARARAQ